MGYRRRRRWGKISFSTASCWRGSLRFRAIWRAHFPLEQMAIDLSSPDTAPNYAWFAANESFNGEGPIDFPWGILKFALSQLEPGNPYNIQALDQFLSETVPVVLDSAVWQDPTRRSALTDVRCL